MKFLKMKYTRITAFIAACIIVAGCTFRFMHLFLRHEKIINNDDDYISEMYGYSEDVNQLYKQLWAVGNIYLRYLDEDGSFTGSPELKASTEAALKEKGLMNSSGEITIYPNNDKLEYHLSWGENEISNTNKNFEEVYNEQYSFLLQGNKEYLPDHMFLWSSGYDWYSTNYGMYYYTFAGESVAVFDFDTTNLDFYYDNYGTKIYYKTDGTTPVPDYNNLTNHEEYNESYFENTEPTEIPTEIYNEENPDIEAATQQVTTVDLNYNDEIIFTEVTEYTVTALSEEYYQNETETTTVQPESSVQETDGFYIYDDNNQKWVRIDNGGFLKYPGDQSKLRICITPVSEVIAAHETAYSEREKASERITSSLINLIPLGLIAIILTIYFLIAGGYSVEKKKFIMGSFDGIFAEFCIVCIIGAVLGGVLLLDDSTSILEFAVRYYEKSVLIAAVYAAAYTLIFIIVILLLNSLIIRVKCHCFWKTTLTGRIIRNLYSMIKRFAGRVKDSCVSREMLRNDIFTRRFLLRLVSVIATEILVIIFSVSIESFGSLVFLTIILLLVYIILNFADLKALEKLGEQISDMNNGDYSKHEVPDTSATYGMTCKLNNISDGIQLAVDKQLKSERMKIDLVTNVSHDLKTPLTSIISYINLLSMEELSPEARDYVKILENKSERLNAIVADLFDLAKATSRTDVNAELIDAVILVGQVLADLSDKISERGREIRTDISVETAPINAEGKKLYRVLQNLIDNALKYSLEGTRIYLTLQDENGEAVIRLKNISCYEMKFTPDEIVERFTRGDESRSGEGNGLGLSIAKSFTEACGGSFRIIIDGDLFIAEIRLPLVETNES